MSYRTTDTPVAETNATGTAVTGTGGFPTGSGNDPANVTGTAGFLTGSENGSERSPEERVRDADHRGWYSRNYLPHFDGEAVQFITFRLADSLPERVLKGLLEQKCDARPAKSNRDAEINRLLDQGLGRRLLSDPANASIVERALLNFDGRRYHLLAWTIMPNHVHVLADFACRHSLGSVVKSWKGYMARAINARMGRSGPVWYREYFDRYIRDERHLKAVIDYIDNNPVKAGLCREARDWGFGSARYVESGEVALAGWKTGGPSRDGREVGPSQEVIA